MTIELSLATWIYYIVTVTIWGLSILLIKDRFSQRNIYWTTIPLSLFGLAWLFFGIIFISRFLILVYDPVLFQVTRLPIWQIPVEVFNWEWIFLASYWLAFCLGFFIVVRWMAPKAPKTMEKLEQLVSLENVPVLDVMAFTASLVLLLTKPGLLPEALVTPFGHLGRFFVIPLLAAWFMHFRGMPIGARRFIYIVPGVILYLIYPYRTHLAIIAICILLPALQSRRWVSFKKIFLVTLILLVTSTAVTDFYRAKIGLVSERAGTIEERWDSWQENPKQAPWVRLVRRFSGFDTFAVTIYYVPSYFPYSNIDIFTDMLLRLVPRAIWDTKPDTHRGRKFSTTIWAMDSKGLQKRTEANVSPTMCGDLYAVHGIYMIILGALIYGLIVGLLQSWKNSAGPLSGCILLIAFGIPVTLGIEQEFGFAVCTIGQLMIIFWMLLWILPYKKYSHSILRLRPEKK